MCFGCSKEVSHRDGSFEYPQHMFWLRNKKNSFQLCTLIWRSAKACLENVNTVKHVLSAYSKLDKTKVLKTDGSLMQVKIIIIIHSPAVII